MLFCVCLTCAGHECRRPSSIRYFLYNQDVRPQLKAGNPNLTAPEVVKLLSKGWQALGTEEKKEYADKSATAMAAWKLETAAYQKKKQSSAAQ